MQRDLAVAMIAGALVGLSGCQRRTAESPAEGGNIDGARLVVISPHSDAIRDAFATEFSLWYEDKYDEIVDLRWIYMGTVECQRYILERFDMDRDVRSIGIDAFFGGGVPVHSEIIAKGYVKPIKVNDALLEAIPATLNGRPLRSEDGTWYGTALSGFGILYNRKACAARNLMEPTTWADLAEPEYAGWNGLADPSASGSTLQCLLLILIEEGWDAGWGTLTGVLANCNGLSPSSTQVGPNVESGLVVAGLTPEFVARRLIGERQDTLAYVNPPGTMITPDPISILKGAPNLKVATRFVEFILSEEGQKLWVLSPEDGGPISGPLYQNSIRPDIYAKYADHIQIAGNPFEGGVGMKPQPELEQAYTRLLPVLIEAACSDNHLLLQQAWRAASQTEAGTAALDTLKRPPFPQAQALEYARQCAEDPVRTGELLHEWSQLFRKRYQDAIEALPGDQGRR